MPNEIERPGNIESAVEQDVLYDVRDGVAVITFNRPQRLNAWTNQMETHYYDLLEQAADDTGVRVIVLTGQGRGFCAGADMALLLATAQAEGGQYTDPARFNLPLIIPKPIIAAINGACAGIGFIHALMCDLRFAASGAKFTTAFARRGLIGEYNAPWLLARLIGQGAALDLLYSARVFQAEEAKELGVVNRVYPADALMDETLAYARELATECSPASLAMMKKQVYEHLETGLQNATAQTLGWMFAGMHAPDLMEGVESFMQKRPPRFRPLASGVRLDRDVPGFVPGSGEKRRKS